MAQLNHELAPAGWTAAQTRAQFQTIAWLRWRIFVNALRRKGGAGELVARIILYPILAGFALLPTIGVGFFAFYFAQGGRLGRISILLWCTFGLCQLLNIQLGQPGTTFDPTQLIRFPMRVGGYTAVRLFFGILTPANIIGSMMALAMAVGVAIAVPALWACALLTMAVFAAANVLFSRMIFAWVDRWLSTRRAREVFTGLIFAVSLGFQWLNFSYNPAYNRHGKGMADPSAKITAAASFYHRAQPVLNALPPGLSAQSLVKANAGQLGAFAGLTLGCAAFAAAFLAVFALRMRTEFRGENLSDVANAVSAPVKRRPTSQKRDVGHPAVAAVEPMRGSFASGSRMTAKDNFAISPVLAGMLGKELLYIRRNMGLFYSVVAPLVFVMLLAGKMANGGAAVWVFPAAIAYTLLGISPLSYNSFGLEGAGAQFYFLAPVRLRDVFVAKNLMNFGVALLEAAAVYAIVSYTSAPPPVISAVVAVLWAGGTLLLTCILGNRRSISAPKQINMGRAGSGKHASPLSALIAMGVLLLSVAVAAAIFGAAMWFKVMWVLVPVFALFFAGALWAYLLSLRSVDAFAMDHREQLFEELCKKA
jgi:ABC-2 type transport system permease protein